MLYRLRSMNLDDIELLSKILRKRIQLSHNYQLKVMQSSTQ
jgi:hypothetical protein